MLQDRTIILGTQEKPLMWLESLKFSNYALVDAAKEELHARWATDGDPQSPWGFYAIEGHADTEYPCCAALRDAVTALLPHDLSFGFIQYSPPALDARNGKLHLDVHKLNAIESEDARPQHSCIQRILLNANTHPRHIKYLPCTRDDLATHGLTYSYDEYQPVEQSIYNEETVSIPPIDADGLWQLTFYGDQIPHVGYTDKGGQMLICFGKYVHSIID